MSDDQTPPTGEDLSSPGRHTYRAVSVGARRAVLGALVAVVIAVTAFFLATRGSEQPALDSGPTTVEPGSAAAVGAQPPELDAKTAEDQLGSGFVGLRVTRTQLLRTRPDPTGRLVGKAGRRTPFGGPTILPIIKAIGNWVAVISPYRKNNKVTWTKVRDDARYVKLEYSIAIRLRKRSIVVRRNGEVIKRFTAAIGDVTHPTPTGRFAVTDGLIFKTKVRGPYGCCALVLSARQPILPSGWTGGDRIAIHGTPNKQSIGLAASLGCLRVGDEASRWLVRKVPAGTSVFVRP